MVVIQKITRSTAILSKHDSKCKEMREWIFIANYTLRNFRSQAFKTQKTTVIIMFWLEKSGGDRQWLSVGKGCWLWFDSLTGNNASLCPWERLFTLISHLDQVVNTCCGGPVWQNTWKQNPQKRCSVLVWLDRCRRVPSSYERTNERTWKTSCSNLIFYLITC